VSRLSHYPGASPLWGSVVKRILLAPDHNQICSLCRSKTFCCPGSTVNETGVVLLNITFRLVRTTIAVEKQCFTYSERVSVAVFIQPAKRMRLIMLSYVVSPIIPCFYTLPQKKARFSGGGTQNTCSNFLNKFFLKHFLF
jgi:hypothetical protein